jgi:predicted negative regulator of RcsB-dependent stress response
MQAQDAPTLFIYKLWPWIEENRKQIIIGAVASVAVVLVYSFISYRHDQGEIIAGQAVTHAVILSQQQAAAAGDIAKAYLSVAADHPGTAAATRAQLQGATALFEAGQYADAQAQFQKFIDANPDSPLKATATFGVAASLEAQGQAAQALTVYQRVADYADPSTVLAAKFAVARLDEQAGRPADALTYYEAVASAAGNTQLGAEAGIRAIQLKATIAPEKNAAPSLISKP